MAVSHRPLSRRLFVGTALTALVGCRRQHDNVAARSGSPRVQPLPRPKAPPPAPADASGHSPAPKTTPTCRVTASNIEGPFFKPGAPARVSLIDTATVGERLTLTGRVLDERCQPIRGAQLEFWHADHAGAYDNVGFSFRASVVCDERGAYALETIVPGRYLNGARYRPAHIHVKVHAPGRPSLTTQLYFAGDPYNEGDPFIVDTLIMPLRDGYASKLAAFDLVLG